MTLLSLLTFGFIPVKLMLQHYVELVIILLALVNYRHLQRNALTALLPMVIIMFILDVILENSYLRSNVRVLYLFECLLIFFGIWILPALRSHKATPLIGLMLSSAVISFWMDAYWVMGQFNIFIYNLN